jgi:hypothetical protein
MQPAAFYHETSSDTRRRISGRTSVGRGAVSLYNDTNYPAGKENKAMAAEPKVTHLEVTEFEYELKDMGTDYNGFNLVYEKGNVAKRRMAVLQIFTDAGIVGETVTSAVELSTVPIWANYLIGKNALEREKLYSEDCV